MLSEAAKGAMVMVATNGPLTPTHFSRVDTRELAIASKRRHLLRDSNNDVIDTSIGVVRGEGGATATRDS